MRNIANNVIGCGSKLPKNSTVAKKRLNKPLFWLLLGFAGALPINMANTAHLLGLISGCLLALIKIKGAVQVKP